MSNPLLMHDYCIFPGPPEDSEAIRFDEFLSFSRINFERDWEEASSLSSTSDSDLFPPMNSPFLTMEETTMNLSDLGLDFNSPPSASVPSPLAESEEGYLATAPTPDDDFYNMFFDKKDGFLGSDADVLDDSGIFSLMSEENAEFSAMLFDNMNPVAPIIQESTITVGAVHVQAQDLNTPTAAAPAFPQPAPISARTTGRRKSGHLIRTESSTPEFETLDIKPIMSELTAPGRGKKRPAAAAPSFAVPCTNAVIQIQSQAAVSSSAPQPSKKIKKYELNDPNNHSVRNAKAAKANRDKKKQLEVEMKAKIESLQQQLLDSETRHTRKDQIIEQITLELSHERQKNLAGNGLNAIKEEIRQFLTTIVPATQAAFGPIQIQMAPGLASGQIPIQQIPVGMTNLNNVQPSQILTTHMDFQNRTLTYDYDPLFNASLLQ